MLVTELRWILLGLSVALLAGIWWWGARRSRQTPGNAALRESGAVALSDGSLGPTPQEPPSAYRTPDADSRDWGVPPFEPLSIRTADFDAIAIVDVPMTAHCDAVDVTLNEELIGDVAGAAEPLGETHLGAPAPVVAAAAATASALPAPVAPAPVAPSASETQRIVTIRVSAAEDTRWPGSALLNALNAHGLSHGRYKVFHRKHSDGRSLFCAASLVEPGTFDLDQMPEDEFRGLTLFAVLPGPADAVQTIDALIATAQGLAEELQGIVQDSNGAPLTPQRAEALREDIARFQALLNMG